MLPEWLPAFEASLQLSTERFAAMTEGVQQLLSPCAGLGCSLAMQGMGDRPEVLGGVLEVQGLNGCGEAVPDS